MTAINNPEYHRLYDHRTKNANWKNWGPYLSERSWGTVREDDSPDGKVWEAFTHDHARMRTYRWNEDGLGGICDRFQHLCLAFAFWNGQDSILKERLFGLTGPEGNHGEDVKECYYYLDSTPTHSYMKMLYKYPQKAFPYKQLVEENKKRTLKDPEFELIDTGIFSDDRYFDIFIEYAKASEEDILCKITLANRGAESASITLLPTLWYRNTWSWGYENGPMGDDKGTPRLFQLDKGKGFLTIEADHSHLGNYFFYAKEGQDLLFTNNETNEQLLFGKPNPTPYVKDAFHRYFIKQEKAAVNPKKEGTKACAFYPLTIGPQKTISIQLRLSSKPLENPFSDFDPIFAERLQEADDYYASVQKSQLSSELKMIQRQAFAGVLWSKQLYYLDQEQWAEGDPKRPIKRKWIRNEKWDHFYAFDILSMPDKWEYPYFCAWDLAFHCVPIVLVDPDLAKRMLTLMTREWYMHPSGHLPSYEWAFSDVNPPVHAWAIWRSYKIDAKMYGEADRAFLEGVFHKLLINFTWWVNRKDIEDNNVFQGGFLGMDNISIFDRSATLPTGGHIDQSDGSAWMAFYCILMMKIALHLSAEEPVYQDIATKFFEHFLRISSAMHNCGGRGVSLWNEEDGFYYDVIHLPDGKLIPLKVRSLVGLLPLLAVETMDSDLLEKLPVFTRRMDWFIGNHHDAHFNVACIYTAGAQQRRLLSILTKERLVRVLKYLLDENEFLSPYGIRSLSKVHEKNPYRFAANGNSYEIKYVPGDSDNRMFGGNSNWRGPVWFPINFLLIESLQKYHHYYGDDLKVEFPTGSGHYLNLWDVAKELSKRLIRPFLPNSSGKRPIYGDNKKFQEDPHFRSYVLFPECLHGDLGIGVGASHQTGWTALVAKLIQQVGDEL